MVSVKRASLPREYIDSAKTLVSALLGNDTFIKYDSEGNFKGIVKYPTYNINYAFFFLDYGENESWYDGTWKLLIATDDFSHDQEGVIIVNELLKSLNITLDEFDYVIDKPDFENHSRIFDRIDIKN